MKDIMDSMYGHVKIQAIDSRTGKIVEEYDLGKNNISYRAKAIMSRLLGAGLGSYDWGTAPNHPLGISGIAVGNGGHLIYDDDSKATDVLPKSTGVVLGDNLSVTHDDSRVAMPRINVGQWGYDGTTDRTVPGSTYELVENGNVPWDGTINIQDNAQGTAVVSGVPQGNITLYSETFRFPLDAGDGISFPSATEVQFKATLPSTFLNYTDPWGYANYAANKISEAALISGYVPAAGALSTGQVYSIDGNEPTGQALANTASKDTGLYDLGTPGDNQDTAPVVVTAGSDGWAGNKNTWNMVARKNFPVINKTPSLSFVFVWVIGF